PVREDPDEPVLLHHEESACVTRSEGEKNRLVEGGGDGLQLESTPGHRRLGGGCGFRAAAASTAQQCRGEGDAQDSSLHSAGPKGGGDTGSPKWEPSAVR